LIRGTVVSANISPAGQMEREEHIHDLCNT
jgi:hypothetical protein